MSQEHLKYNGRMISDIVAEVQAANVATGEQMAIGAGHAMVSAEWEDKELSIISAMHETYLDQKPSPNNPLVKAITKQRNRTAQLQEALSEAAVELIGLRRATEITKETYRSSNEQGW